MISIKKLIVPFVLGLVMFISTPAQAASKAAPQVTPDPVAVVAEVEMPTTLGGLQSWVNTVDQQSAREVFPEAVIQSEYQAIEQRAQEITGRPVSLDELRNYRARYGVYIGFLALAVIAAVIIVVALGYLLSDLFKKVSAEAWYSLMAIAGVVIIVPTLLPVTSSFGLGLSLSGFVSASAQVLGTGLFGGGLTLLFDKADIKGWLIPGILTALACAACAFFGPAPFMGVFAILALSLALIVNGSDNTEAFPIFATCAIGLPSSVIGLVLKSTTTLGIATIGFQSGLLYVGALWVLVGSGLWSCKFYLEEGKRGSALRNVGLYWPLQALFLVIALAGIGLGVMLSIPNWSLMAMVAIVFWVFIKYAEWLKTLEDVDGAVKALVFGILLLVVAVALYALSGVLF